MPTPKIVDHIKVCAPITSLLDVLIKHNGIIKSQKLADYHFSELYFEVAGAESPLTSELPQEITNPEQGVYCCTCHWSTVKLIP